MPKYSNRILCFPATTCTGQKCYWIGGSNKKDPGVVRDKPAYYPKMNFDRRGHFNPLPSKYKNPSPEEQLQVVENFSKAILSLPVRPLYAYQLHQHVDNVSLPDADFAPIIAEYCSYIMWNLNTIRFSADGNSIEIPRTMDQYLSPFWHSERSIRVNASKAREFLGLTSDKAKINYLRRQMWGFKGYTSQAMCEGIENEGIAKRKYVAEFMCPDSFLMQTGSIVNPDYPQLICSPDGIVVSESEFLLFETKYCSILNGADPKDFETVLTNNQRQHFYLKYNENGDLVLKENHAYYYQVQMSLDILRLTTCAFAVLSGQRDPDKTIEEEDLSKWKMVVVTVHYDESFWREKRARIIKKHRELILPEYFMYRTLSNLPPRELQYEEYHEDENDDYFQIGCRRQFIYYHLRTENDDLLWAKEQ